MFNQQNFTDQILQHANTTFSTLHAKFLKKIWGDNNTTKKLHNNQVYTDWQNGVYEAYIPTRDSMDNNLEYLRIAIQVLPEVSNDTKHQKAYDLSVPIKMPLGNIESEFLILIAPRQDKWGLVKGFKHRNKRGYFTGVFVNKSSDIIWKRVLDQIINFFLKRTDGLFRSLGFETWVWKWAQHKDSSLLYYIVEHFSYVIRQSVFTFVKLYQHLMGKMKEVLNEIGLQNTAKTHLRTLEVMNPRDLSRYFMLIRDKLDVTLHNQSFRPDELKVLQVLRNG